MKPIFLIVLLVLYAAACSSSDSTPTVLATDFVSDVNPKIITQTQVDLDNPENNTTETNTLVYENGMVKEIDFLDNDGTSGVIKVVRDNVGNVTKTETYFSNSGTLTESSYLDYVYTKGVLTSMKKYFFYNNAFMILENTTFTYNSKNQMTNMKVVNGSGTTLREYTYTYVDDSTNPSQVDANIETNNFTFTNACTYETTASPMIVFFQIRGFIDQALIKNNLTKITGIVTTSTIEDRYFNYSYDGNNRTTKIVQTYANGSETWEFGY